MKSDNAKKGVARAPHRSLFYAMGYTDEELDRPLIGVCCAKNEIIPGHIELDRIAEAVKSGVRIAGGTPIEFPAIGVCDGIAMGHEGMKYSLVTRELIADSIECMAKAHQFDALVMIPNCDKIVPGMLMAAARLDLPTVFVSGGPMMPGRLPGKDMSNPYSGRNLSLTDMFEAVGAVSLGRLTEAQLHEMERVACPGCGACSGMFTANSMNCLTESIGLGLPGNGTIPAATGEWYQGAVNYCEEKGIISMAREGRLTRHLDARSLTILLTELFTPDRTMYSWLGTHRREGSRDEG